MISNPPLPMVALAAVPPDCSTRVPPAVAAVRLATPPDSTSCRPPNAVAPLARPSTTCVPPPLILAPLSMPPAETALHLGKDARFREGGAIWRSNRAGTVCHGPDHLREDKWVRVRARVSVGDPPRRGRRGLP